jgi:GT2 family glycosyltransferase
MNAHDGPLPKQDRMTLPNFTGLPEGYTDTLPQPHLGPVATSTPLTSVLVPCCGQLEYTRICVPSLLKHTPGPYELIFLDIASLDGTAEFLAGVAAAAPVRVEVVRTLTDVGIAAACNEAVARARGDFLVVLNNDTVVTPNWLRQLVGLAGLAPEIGLVGPMSNYAAPAQGIEPVPYRVRTSKPAGGGLVTHPIVDTADMERFAQDWHEQHRGKWMEVDRLAGFCLLIKRQLLSVLGPMPAQPGLKLFDTDALCLKARQAGYTLACCRDVFIHNFGSRGPTA